MLSKKYILSYLPLFYEDVDEKVTYILEKLKNLKAVNDLIMEARRFLYNGQNRESLL